MAKNYKDFDDSDGVWRTIGGRRVFIKNGQSLSEAMKESGKFSRVAKNQELYKKVEEENKKDKERENKFELSEKQKEVSDRLNEKAKQHAQDDIKEYLGGNKGDWDEDGDFIRDLANEYNLELDEAKKMFNDAKRNDFEKSLEGKKENERLEIAKDIVKELNPSLKSASDERLEKEAREILSPPDGYVLDKSETTYTNANGEIERSTESLKKWRDSLTKTKEPRDELAGVSGGVISTLKTNVPTSKMERIKPGTEIYYKGDQANTPGYFTVESFDPSKEQFMSSITLKEKGGEGRTKKIGAQQIEDSYVNNYASRFSFKEDYDNYRNRVYEEMAKKYGTKENTTKSTNETMNKTIREKASKKTNSQFEVSDLKAKALASLPKEHIDTHGSDLYIKKTKESDALLENMKNKNSGLLTTFKDQKTGETWYDVPFGNMSDDFKEKTSGNEIDNSLRQKAYKKYLKEHPNSKLSFEDFKDMKKQ